MSKKVILANIGNRNLKVVDKGYIGDFIPNSNFREKTKKLLELYEKEKNSLELNILPPLLEKFPSATLILFSSDQEKNNNQDTLYEAELIKKIIEERYQQMKVQIECLAGVNPTNENALIEQFTLFVKHRSSLFPTYDDVIYYDAGGTPQQKSSLRAVLEFYFPCLIQYYGVKSDTAKTDVPTKLRKLERKASELLVLKRQVKTVLENYNYAGAIALSKQFETSKSFEQLSKIMLNSWNQLNHTLTTQFRWEHLNSNLQKHPQVELIKAAYKEPFEDDYFYRARILLHKFHAQHEIKDYTSAIITLQQVIETFALGLVSILTNVELLNIGKNFNRKSETALGKILKEYGQVIEQEMGRRVKSLSLPVQLIFLGLHPEVDTVDKTFIREMKTVIGSFPSKLKDSQKIDVYRNRAVHKGIGLKSDVFTLFYSDFIQRLDAYFEYQESANLYTNMNLIAVDFL